MRTGLDDGCFTVVNAVSAKRTIPYGDLWSFPGVSHKEDAVDEVKKKYIYCRLFTGQRRSQSEATPQNYNANPNISVKINVRCTCIRVYIWHLPCSTK